MGGWGDEGVEKWEDGRVKIWGGGWMEGGEVGGWRETWGFAIQFDLLPLPAFTVVKCGVE